MQSLWTDSDGTLVAELSTLIANNSARMSYGKTIIKMPNGGEFLLESASERDTNSEGETEGWRWTSAIDGKKYLVIND